MIKVTVHSKTKSTTPGLTVNFLLSWMILPLAVPPFRSYSIRELLIALHMLIAFSLAVIWHQVLNGYDFMMGNQAGIRRASEGATTMPVGVQPRPTKRGAT